MTTVSKTFRVCSAVSAFDANGKVVAGGAIRGMKIVVDAAKGKVASTLLDKLAGMFPTARLVSYDLAVLVYCDPERTEPDFVVRPE